MKQTYKIQKKYEMFNKFVNNLDKYISTDKIINQNIQKSHLIPNKNLTNNLIKLQGSKIFSLDATNSFSLKENLSKDNDYSVKMIEYIEKLSMHSTPLKYLNKNEFYIKKPFILTSYIEHNKINSNQKTKLFFINKNENINNSNNIEIFNTNVINKNNETNNEFKKSINANIIFETINKNKLSELNEINEINSENNNENVNVNHPLYRQDYYVKQFKVHYSIWLRNILNRKLKILLKETNSNKKHIKFYPLNSLQFTANPKYEDNKIFLSKKIKNILIVGIDCMKSSNQKKNKKNIEIVEKIYEESNQEIKCDLLSFLNITMEDSIKIFYDEEEFQKFKNLENIIYFDKKFYQEKNFSLLEKYGFIELIKNYKGNSKSSSGFSCSKLSI